MQIQLKWNVVLTDGHSSFHWRIYVIAFSNTFSKCVNLSSFPQLEVIDKYKMSLYSYSNKSRRRKLSLYYLDYNDYPSHLGWLFSGRCNLRPFLRVSYRLRESLSRTRESTPNLNMDTWRNR